MSTYLGCQGYPAPLGTHIDVGIFGGEGRVSVFLFLSLSSVQRAGVRVAWGYPCLQAIVGPSLSILQLILTRKRIRKTRAQPPANTYMRRRH